MSIKKKLKLIIKDITICILTKIRNIRGFDPSFEVYCPDIFNKKGMLLWRLKVLYPLLNIDVNFRKEICNDIPLDIYIPISLKDLISLEKVILNAKKYIKHPINEIYVVAAPESKIIQACNNQDVTFVDEKIVLGYDKNSLNYKVNDTNRAGWLFQQLLKLGADKIVKTENFLILDADTIFIKPKVFFFKGKLILDQSEERHEVYHNVYQELLKRPTSNLLSFITHYMIFNKEHLRSLKMEIESIHKKKWDQAIISCVNYNELSGFSEYELYGNYLSEIRPNKFKREYWFNTTAVMEIYPTYIKTVSFHSYLTE